MLQRKHVNAILLVVERANKQGRNGEILGLAFHFPRDQVDEKKIIRYFAIFRLKLLKLLVQYLFRYGFNMRKSTYWVSE